MARRYPLGLLFHLAIAVTMGLSSFFFATAALLTLVFAVPIQSELERRRLDHKPGASRDERLQEGLLNELSD